MSGKNQRISICSVGDLMICDSPLYASVGVGSKYPEIKDRLFQNCKHLFEDADIVMGNFETVVHSPYKKSLKEIQMCCPETVVEDLGKAGFSILNIANNHCMQHGVKGFQATKASCERNHIKPIGIKDENPYFVDIKGFRLAFISLCIHLEWYEPDHILYENSIIRILREVDDLRGKESDTIIIISVHWGDEFATYPSNAQVALAHILVEHGANVILGHHSHVYQGIEEYHGAIIVYGQGNFISDMAPEICRQTGIVKIDIGKDQRARFKMFPYYIGNDLIPVETGDKWFKARQKELQYTLSNKYTEDDYWDAVSRNHAQSHNEFKLYFMSNIANYKPVISLTMVLEFIGRKFKRVIGTTTDGRISSMDPEIYYELSKIKNNSPIK